MKTLFLTLIFAAGVLNTTPLAAQVPQALNYQGRVTVNGIAFTGPGQFRFALVDGTGTALWSSHASAFTNIPVSGGLYTVRLGDTSLTNMAGVPSSLFSNPDLRLRVWFNDGINGVQQLSPDQRLTPVGYAHRAASVDTVPPGAIPPGSIHPSQLANSAQSGYADVWEVPPSGGTVTVAFSEPFESIPAVTFDGAPVAPGNVTPTGFTLTIPVHSLLVDDGLPVSNNVGKWMDMILVAGNPAIAYTDDTSGDLKYVRASDPAGSAWNSPATIVVGGAAIVGAWCSMAIVSGRPAIAYYDETNMDLKFIRANDATGSTWSAPVTVAAHATSDYGKGCRLKTFSITDVPMIVWLDATAATLRVSRSNNPAGTTWAQLVLPDGTINLADPSAFDMDAASDGRPVIAYCHPATNQVRLVKTTSTLLNWEIPVNIGSGPVSSLDLFTAGGSLALKFSDTVGTFSAYQVETRHLSREVICGPFPSSRIVEGTFPFAVFASGFGPRLAWSAAQNELGYSWSQPRNFEAQKGNNSHALSAVRLADGSVLAAYRGDSNNGQLMVSSTAAPYYANWTAGIASPMVATALAPNAIRLEDLPDDLFGSQNYRSGPVSFAIGRYCKALGEYSVALGISNIAGNRAFAAGDNNTAGDGSTALGTGNSALGDNATALGLQNKALGRQATVMGRDSVASGDYSFAAGVGARAETAAEIPLGTNPTPNSGTATSWVSTDRLFEIGNGQYFTGSNSNALTILKDGRVGLGSIDSNSEITHCLTLPNSSTLTIGQARANAWTTYSDSRIKTAQRPIAYGLKEIMKLQPRAYTQHSGCVEHGTFKCEDETGGSAATIGFIAQEVEEIIPEAVQKPADPANQLYGMSYEKLIPVLVKATQELKSENDTLKSQLGVLRQRLEKLERSVTRKK